MTLGMEPDVIHQNFLSRQSKFDELKRHFIDISSPHVTAQVLDNLKDLYSDIIQSKRDRDRVNSIAELLRILEKRDLLRYDSIEPLKQIANNFIKDRVLEQKVAHYEAGLKNEPPLPAINHYKYRGEYFESSDDNEYLLNNPDNDHGQPHRIIPNHRVDETEDCERNEQQSLTQQMNIRKSRHSGSHSPCHARHTYFCSSIKCSCRRKTSLIVIFSMMVVGLTIFPTIYMHSINAQSSAVDRSSQGSSRSQSHTVNFYTTPTLPVIPYSPSAPSAAAPSAPVHDVQERVFQRVSENLGKHWKDLARFLNVKESEIDAINEKTHLGTKEKAYEALLIFKSRCERCNWRLKIQQALEKARRKDLAEQVSEIMLSDDQS